MTTITFTICIGVRGPIKPGDYVIRDKHITVSYPTAVDLGLRRFELPKSLSTMFVLSWEDETGATSKQLLSKSFERHIPIYAALDAISELLLAYKLVRIGHSDGRGMRTVGIADVLMYFSAVDGMATGDLNTGLKNYAGNNAWDDSAAEGDPHGTSQLAAPHIGTDSMPLARRYVRCYELLEHGFYSEAFIVAFSILDDFVQKTLDQLFQSKGFTRRESTELLRGIKENRLKLYLGALLKLAYGRDIASMWPESLKALDWLNSMRNDIAHGAARVDHATAAKGIYACLRVLVALREHGVATVELSPEIFRHAKISAAWTTSPPAWIPRGEAAESMDFRS